MKKKIILISTLTLLTNAFADHSEPTGLIEKLSDQTKEFRKDIHSIVVETSKKVDNFFFEKTLDDASYNNSYALLELSASHDEDNDTNFDQRFRIKLKLPRLKEIVHLEIESDEKRDTEDFVEDKNSKSKNDNVSVGLAYLKKLENEINLRAKTGVKVKTSSIDPFIKIEADKIFHYKYFDLELDQQLKYSEKKELESTSYFKLSKVLNTKYSLHNYNQYYWHSKSKADSQFYNSLYLNQKLSSKSYIQYQIDINTNNVDDNTQNENLGLTTKRYSAKVKYRHYIKDWMYFDAIPENYYSRSNNFDSRYAITFNLGIYFNKSSY